MAKKEASPERYMELNGGRPVTFVNYDMSEGEKKQYKKWLEGQNAEALLDFVSRAIETGYGVSIKHDDYNDCLAAYLSSTQDGNPNKGLILSGRGRIVATALANVVYKHFVLFDAHWPEASSRKKATDEE